jgi:biotin/methionine sulfoxide reductase
MLGQIGLPGGGYTVAYAVNGHIGNTQRPFPTGSFPQGADPVAEFIPVAMISDMLLNPGATYRYDGQTRRFPDIRMVWWAGGNPFHHHQDLNRLRAAFQKPETVVVNEINWTAAARHADIVLPAAASTERVDFGAGRSDNILVPMPKLAEPPGEARVEYDIYPALSQRLGTFEAFTEGRSAEGWAEHLWNETRASGARHGIDLPDWQRFIAADAPVELPDPSPNQVFLAEYRADPGANPRATPSGKIELFSETVAGFDLVECPGHAVYVPMRDRRAGLVPPHPLHLISGQPATRLHSQLDNGAYSLSQKIQGREPVLIHPADAAARGIADGQLVELHNDRGICIAGARVTDGVMQGVVFLWTGAWYDPEFAHPQTRDRHGNPNVLTHDLRSSEWTQSPASHSALVEIRPLEGEAPPVQAFDPPAFVTD